MCNRVGIADPVSRPQPSAAGAGAEVVVLDRRSRIVAAEQPVGEAQIALTS